jgi:hypothetical protein
VTRRPPLVAVLLALPLAACSSRGCARSEAPRGKELFEARCAVCHSITSESAQGPGLGGVVGRAAGRLAGFSSTRELASSGITWSESSLDRFLAAPSALVPGTKMALAVEDASERRAIVAYLATLTPTKPTASGGPVGSGVPPAPPTSLEGAAAYGDYRFDGPGVKRRFRPGDLPEPFVTESARNGSEVVARPPGVDLHVPPGFVITQIAGGLSAPRRIAVAPNGDLFFVETNAGRLRILRLDEKGNTVGPPETFASDLQKPFGIAFYPPGPDPRWVYVGNTDSIVRYPYENGALRATAAAQTIVPKLSEKPGGHSTRDLVFSRDGARMFVTVGSATNVAESIRDKAPSDLGAWQKQHGLGAAWGEETGRAAVRVFDPDGKNERPWANGLRNCVGLAMRPDAPGDEPWCAVNERDGLGDDLAPDYVTRVREGAFYGWPWYYIGAHEDPRQKAARPDLRDSTTVPDVLLQPHSAPLQLAFHDGTSFGEDYRGDVFVALHGSWNRKKRTGYKIVRMRVENGVPGGDYEDFVTGFVLDDRHVWGRPVGIAVARDGAVVFTDDGNGTMWRVSKGK